MKTKYPIALFSPELLEGMLQKQIRFFVRQQMEDAAHYFSDTGQVRYFVLSHYADEGKALGHMQAKSGDPYRRLYRTDVAEDMTDLRMAATQPEGFKIYTTLLDGHSWKPPRGFDEKIKSYLRHAGHFPKRTDELTVSPFFEFGVLFLKFKWSRNEIRVPYSQVDN